MGGRFWSLLRERRGAGWAGQKAKNRGCEQPGDFLNPLLVGHVIRIASRWHGAPPMDGSARNDIRFTTVRCAAEPICGTLLLVTYARGSRVVRNGPPWRNVLLTWRGLLTRESESFGPFGTGCRGETWHFGEGARVSSRTRESNGGASRRSRVAANRLTFCGFGDAHEKTPGTLALGVSCQPAGSVSSLPNVRLPELDSNLILSG